MNNKIPHRMEVLENLKIAKETYRMTLRGEIDFSFDAGTFLNIKLNDGRYLLRRPISVYSVDEDKRTITIIYKILGEGTKILSNTRQGEYLDCMGPLGTGFPIQDNSHNILLVGGGVGVPPLYELGKRLKKEGKKIVSVLGFKDKESIFSKEDFEALGELIICTDDGSYGFKGNVLEAIKEGGVNFEALYSCGPKAMLMALIKEYGKDKSKKGWVSFEERMACGIGACYGCMTKTKDGLKRVCKDGPVFSIREFIYD